MPELAIIVPTRGRPENVQRVIGAWDFTNAWDHADLVLVADADDPEIQRYRDLVEEFHPGSLGTAALHLVEIPAWLPMVHKLDAAARDAAETYWAVGFAGDDHLPQTIGWAKRYLTVLHELGSGMVYGDDGYQGAKLSTEWAITSDVIRALGRMVPAPVEHMYCDNAMMDLFGQAGAMRHLPEVRIEHMHPVAGKAQTDAQYQRVNHRDQFRTDRRAYEGWLASGAAADVAAVRSLRSGLPEEAPARSRTSAPSRTRGRTHTMSTRPPRFFKRVRGATPEDILITLADLAAQVPGDQEIVELGVFQGRSALQLAWGARQGQGAHVTGVDAWDLEGNTYGPPFTDPGSQRWAQHWVQSLGYGRSITLVKNFASDEAARYSGPPVGLLFVDDDHSYAGARRAVQDWAPHLAPGATIAVDDYDHPDWPGVRMAVDELVDEGFLAPVELFHDRLAVTKLAEPKMKRSGTVTAITSEGVSPSPYPAMDSQVAAGPASVPEKTEPEPVVVRHTEAAPVRELETVELPDVDTSQSTDEAPGLRVLVHTGELEGVAEGTPISELNTSQLRALAKKREIVLGTRKDKRAEMLAALEKGA